jgi:hypothetical protein
VAFGGFIKDSAILGTGVYVGRRTKKSVRKKRAKPSGYDWWNEAPLFVTEEQAEGCYLWPPPDAW